MKKKDYKYFQFPLFLLRDAFAEREKTFEKIINYGIYNFSKTVNYDDLSAVAKQLMYAYYREQKNLSKYLSNQLDIYIDEGSIDIDEDYNGFNGSEFNPEDAIKQLLQIFETDDKFQRSAIEFYQIKQAYSFLGITGDYYHTIEEGKRIEKTIQEKEPFPNINKDLCFEFHDKDKLEFELALLLAYISIKSILGKKSHCRTNKEMIVCRMFGYASKKHLPDNMKPEILELFKKYSNRYHIDSLLKHLEVDNWNIITYSNHIRGLYVGTKDKISLDSMAKAVEKNKKKNKFAEIKRLKEEARQKALQHLNKYINKCI